MTATKILANRFALTLGAFAILTAAASAQMTVKQTKSFEFTANTFGQLNATDIKFDAFDNKLGTLTGVEVTLNYNLSANGNYDRTSSNPMPTEIRAYGTVNATLVGSNFQVLRSMNENAGWAMYQPDEVSFQAPGKVQPNSGNLDINRFTQPGGVTFKVTEQGSGLYFDESISATDAFWINENTRTVGTLEVTYTYAAVPEPGTMIAMGTGIFGLLRSKNALKKRAK
jgi:hypothetical protein